MLHYLMNVNITLIHRTNINGSIKSMTGKIFRPLAGQPEDKFIYIFVKIFHVKYLHIKHKVYFCNNVSIIISVLQFRYINDSLFM